MVPYDTSAAAQAVVGAAWPFQAAAPVCPSELQRQAADEVEVRISAADQGLVVRSLVLHPGREAVLRGQRHELELEKQRGQPVERRRGREADVEPVAGEPARSEAGAEQLHLLRGVAAVLLVATVGVGAGAVGEL